MSDCLRMCIPSEEFDSTIHRLIGVHATEEECLLACACEEASTNGQSSSSVSAQFDNIAHSSSSNSVSGQSSSSSNSVSGQSSSSSNNVISPPGCADNEAMLQISGGVETSYGSWELLENVIFSPIPPPFGPGSPVPGVAAWSASGPGGIPIHVQFNSEGGWWEIVGRTGQTSRISHRAFLNGAAPETSRPWNVTFVHAPTDREPETSTTIPPISVIKVCPPSASSSSSRAPFFTCEPEEASIRLTADFKFDGSSGPITSVNNLILQRTPPGGIVPWTSGFGTSNDPSPISWEGASNGRTIYILYLPNENQSDYWNRWLIGWMTPSASPIPFTNNFLTAYRATTATASPLNSVPWVLELNYEGVYDHAGMSLSGLNVEKYCI